MLGIACPMLALLSNPNKIRKVLLSNFHTAHVDVGTTLCTNANYQPTYDGLQTLPGLVLLSGMYEGLSKEGKAIFRRLSSLNWNPLWYHDEILNISWTSYF